MQRVGERRLQTAPKSAPVVTPREKEHFLVKAYIELFPDITVPISYILEIPYLRDTDLFKKISKNIDGIYLAIIIASFAVMSFAAMGLYYTTSSILQTTFSYLHTGAMVPSIALCGGYIKKYFLLKRNHEEVELVRMTVDALHTEIELLGEEVEVMEAQNKEYIAANKEHKDLLKEARIHHEREIRDHDTVIARHCIVNDQLMNRNRELTTLRDRLQRNITDLEATSSDLRETAARLQDLRNVVTEAERQRIEGRANARVQTEARDALRAEIARLQRERAMKDDTLRQIREATRQLTAAALSTRGVPS